MSKLEITGGSVVVSGHVRTDATSVVLDGVMFYVRTGGCLDLSSATDGATIRHCTVRVEK